MKVKIHSIFLDISLSCVYNIIVYAKAGICHNTLPHTNDIRVFTCNFSARPIACCLSRLRRHRYYIMVRLESPKHEKMMLDGRLEYALGIDVHFENGESIITALPRFKKEAREFEKHFDGRYFSREAHEWVLSNIGAALADFGYFPNRSSRRLTRSFILRTPPEISGDAILLDAPPAQSALFLEFDELIRRGHLIAAKLEDGVCVSCAYTDVPIPQKAADAGLCVEIGVETAPRFRRNGYGSKAVRILCAELCARGFKPLYITGENNTASKKLARSLGFEPIARDYYCILFNKRS